MRGVGWGGGCSKAVCNFSENSSDLVAWPFPKVSYQKKFRQLGYDWGEPVGNAFFGEVGWDASYSMAKVNCVGNESHIQDCPYYPETCCGTTDCYLPWEVAGVTCHRGSHLKGQVELRGGNSSNMGNVWAVNGDGYLGPVCENSCWNCSGINGWDNHEASVVCRWWWQVMHFRCLWMGGVELPSSY